MITVYDFKIPVRNPKEFELKKDEEFFCDYFAESLKKNSLTANIVNIMNSGYKIKILKKSLDLRQKEQKNVYKVLIKLKISDETEDKIVKLLCGADIKARKAGEEEERLFNNDENITANACPYYEHQAGKDKSKVLITGMGPAGIFAAVYLLKNGIRPVLIEKGKCVEDRIKDVEVLMNKGKFNKKSNVVFGEGGAGAFSDGKLTTRKNDPAVSFVLNFLVKMGADKEILTGHKPHIGSDVLMDILKNIRNYLIKNGAEIYFEEELKDFEIDSGSIVSITTDKRTIQADFLVLASGSNSWDTYALLEKKNICMENKPFAAGFRIEHKRDFIDGLFFKGNREKTGLKFNGVYYNVSSKEYGGYSFCMCPGGIVINSSSDENLLSVNGMSYSRRDLENSNSAIVAAVRPDMISALPPARMIKPVTGEAAKKIVKETVEDTVAGRCGEFNGKEKYSSGTGALMFRKDMEIKAFNAGGGGFIAPYQYTPDYIRDVFAGIKTNFNFEITDEKQIPKPSYKPSVKYFNLLKLLPDFLNLSIAGSLIELEKKFKGFVSNSLLTGLETGTSSAVRIKRDADYESVSLNGLYPCGEGSGYSGGIITSAIDGIRCAGAIANKMT